MGLGRGPATCSCLLEFALISCKAVPLLSVTFIKTVRPGNSYYTGSWPSRAPLFLSASSVTTCMSFLLSGSRAPKVISTASPKGSVLFFPVFRKFYDRIFHRVFRERQIRSSRSVSSSPGIQKHCSRPVACIYMYPCPWPERRGRPEAPGLLIPYIITASPLLSSPGRQPRGDPGIRVSCKARYRLRPPPKEPSRYVCSR